MITPGCHQALGAVGRSPLQASPGSRRWRQEQTAYLAPLPMSTSTSRRTLVARAAINIPPDTLVHPFRKTYNGSDRRWGTERVEKKEGEDHEKVKLWFLLTGIDKSTIKQEVEVGLPDGSNVLTIKKKGKQAAGADDLLDVRLLLTPGYRRDGIKVEMGKDDGDGKLFRLEVTINRKGTKLQDIDIK